MPKLALTTALLSSTLFGAALIAATPASAAPAYTTIESCSYPDGWNSGDFVRELNGIPRGIHHQCIDTYQNGRLVARRKANLDD